MHEPGLVWSTLGPGKKDQEIKLQQSEILSLAYNFFTTETLHRIMSYFSPHHIISSKNTYMNTCDVLYNLCNVITQIMQWTRFNVMATVGKEEWLKKAKSEWIWTTLKFNTPEAYFWLSIQCILTICNQTLNFSISNLIWKLIPVYNLKMWSWSNVK